MSPQDDLKIHLHPQDMGEFLARCLFCYVKLQTDVLGV